MTFTARQLRNALGHFPTGVAVVTARAPAGYDVGVTVNSFTSVSLDPPLISFNLSKSLRSLDDLLRAEAFAVNFLQQQQSIVSLSFAKAQSDKWSCAECVPGRTASPVIRNNLAVFECEPYTFHEAGDHVIVLGRVVHFEITTDGAPLLFYRGVYRSIGEEITTVQPEAPMDMLCRDASRAHDGGQGC